MNTSEVRNGLVIPAEEVNRVKCTGELVIYRHVSEKTMELVNNVKCEGAPYKPNHCARTLVMGAGPENIVAEDCSEGAFNGDCNNTAVTVCCINWAPCVYENTRNSEEEISIDTTNKNLKANFREIRPSAVAANKDGVSPRNELEFVNFPIDKRYFSYSSVSCNAKMIGNTESGGTCDTGDRACKQQVHWLRLLHPIENMVNPLGPCENPTLVDIHDNDIGYANPAYPVLVGNSIKVYPTNPFASLPRYDKFLVKEKLQDPTSHRGLYHQPPLPYENHDDVDNNNDVTPTCYRQNCNGSGRIPYTHDRRFNGKTKHPLPNGRAVSNKIGKGGNGFVFTMYHDRKQYAKGENHDQNHCGKFLFCFMDHDTRRMLLDRNVRFVDQNYLLHLMRWEERFSNIKCLLDKTLEALAYFHSNGCVHRDLKASNIMIKMRCHCRPLECCCSSRFQVKLGDFDLAGTVPGFGIIEPTDQMLKLASILPLSTPGYRALKISMHILLSGSCKILCTTTTNIYIGKPATFKQTEEASLLLSRTHTSSTKLWERPNKLEKTRPFFNEQELIRVVEDFLQVLIDLFQEGYFYY